MALQREQVVQTAEKYVSRGKIEPAIKEYRKLLAENPNDINTLNRVGDLYARIQRIEEAVDFFEQIATHYSSSGFFVKAIAIYKKIIKLDPTRLDVYEQLAELYHKQGLVQEARTQYQVLADYYQKHDNAASAIAIYIKMTDLEPENPTYHVKLAEIYHQQQLIEKAMGEYRIIAELMIRHGRTQDAGQVYERALDVDSKNLRFIREGIERLRAAGDTAAAAHLLAVAAERNPEVQAFAEERIEPLAAEPEAREEPAPAAAEIAVEEEPDPRFLPREELKPEPEPAPEPARAAAPSATPADEEEAFEFEIDLGDDLMAAMREAEAAVGGGEPAAAAPAAAHAGEVEIELSFDEEDMSGLVLAIEEVAQEDEPVSQVRPPDDLLSATRRPAWAAQAEDQPEDQPEDDDAFEIELELEDFSLETQPAQRFEDFDLQPLPALAEPEPERVSEPQPEPVQVAPAPAPAPEVREEPARDELVTEAEVLAKYGLEEKAVERLEEALQLRPDNLAALALLIRLRLDKGQHDRVAELANRMLAAAGPARREREPWLATGRRLLDAGYTIDGDRVSAPRSAAPPAPAAPAPAPVPAPPPAAAAPAAAQAGRADVDSLLRGLLDEAPRKPAPPPAAPSPPAPAPPPAAAQAKSGGLFDLTSLGEMIEREEVEGVAAGPIWEPARPAPSPAAPALPPAAPVPVDDASLSWLDEAESRRAAAARGNGNGAAAAIPAAGAPAGGGLFDGDDDFFDLAGELVEELSREEVFQDGTLVQGEQSLEEIVEGFKKGVAEHLSPTDYDTHYNLGIAYREMGLLDEAIGEFQLAAKSGSHLVVCCSMLGLCFLDKGIPDLAIKWYRRGLEAPDLGPEDRLGLLYDLGTAYSAMGDTASAYRTFVEIYGVNTNYRDVTARLEELGRPR